jgi:glutathione S-transferase
VEEVVADPYSNDPALVAANPLVQVPALETEDVGVLTNSPVICAYLDELGSGPRLLPPSGEAHWRVRRMETLADGILEMGVKLLLELRRPETERSPSWMARWRTNLHRALDLAEAEVPSEELLDLGGITLAVAGLWLDFRHPDLSWREGRPGLSSFCDALDRRPSFAATRPA